MLSSKKTILTVAALCAVFLLFTQYSFADTINIDYTKLLDLNCKTIPECLKNIFKEATKLALPVAAVFVFWSGFLYITAMGDTKKIEKAHKTLLWTAVGIFIIVGAWALSVAFGEFFKEL